MSELEIEVTYLLDFLPQDLNKCPHDDILDIYLTNSESQIRLREKNNEYHLTKKTKVNNNDASVQHEQTISLTEEEFNLFRSLSGKELSKTRYYYEYEGLKMEIDLFNGKLAGLALAECEFPTEREKNTFIKPDFCLIDVTQQEYISGANLAGKSYVEIEDNLSAFGYKKIEIITIY